jgi:hypothetical protein
MCQLLNGLKDNICVQAVATQIASKVSQKVFSFRHHATVVWFGEG